MIQAGQLPPYKNVEFSEIFADDGAILKSGPTDFRPNSSASPPEELR